MPLIPVSVPFGEVLICVGWRSVPLMTPFCSCTFSVTKTLSSKVPVHLPANSGGEKKRRRPASAAKSFMQASLCLRLRLHVHRIPDGFPGLSAIGRRLGPLAHVVGREDVPLPARDPRG